MVITVSNNEFKDNSSLVGHANITTSRIHINQTENVVKKGVNDGVLACIRSLMKNTGWTAERAMRMLEIPAAERKRYLNLL